MLDDAHSMVGYVAGVLVALTPTRSSSREPFRLKIDLPITRLL
jgi:hypothetical protein